MLPMLASVRAKQFMPKARTAAVKAMDLDESLVEARTALAFVKWHYDWDWRRAEREFKIALEFQPDHATTHQWYALLLAETGKLAEGISEANRARDLDPGSASIRANLSAVLYLGNRYQESIDTAQASLALDPESLRAHLMMGLSLEQIGKLDEAIAFFGRACRLSREASHSLGCLGHAYGAAGRVAEATSVLKNLRRRRPRRFFEGALVSLGLGNLPETFESIERACEAREFPVVLLRADARFRRLHSTPEFRSILSRIGLAL
jgi:tetratricopeptide (TPR) repeat protein